MSKISGDINHEMLKFPLEIRRFDVKHGFPWKSALPFVDNSRGTLIHRPRSGVTFNCHDKPHNAITFWCGMGVSTSKKNLTFLSVPPPDKILCERCEEAAVKAGITSADKIAGRHVHKGRTIAVVTCCEKTEKQKDNWTERVGECFNLEYLK